MLSDVQWSELEPLVEACRPRAKTPPQDLQRTLSAIRVIRTEPNGGPFRKIWGLGGGRIASPEMLPDVGSLPHLICSPRRFGGGGDDEASEHGDAR